MEQIQQTAAPRPYQHIYEMKQQWLKLLSDNPGPRNISPFQAAYYAVRKGVTVKQAVDKLFCSGKRGLYKESNYLYNRLMKLAEGYYKSFSPKTVSL